MVGLTALPNLRTLDLRECDGLTSLAGLADATPALVQLWLRDLPQLASVACGDNLGQLQTLTVERCGTLVSLAGLPSLPALGELTVSDCAQLQGLHGLPALPSLFRLRAQRCPALTGIGGLPELPALADLTLDDLAGVVALGAFPIVGEAAEIYLSRLPALASLSGMETLTACKRLYISDCDVLPSLQGLDNLDSISYLVGINDNATLSDITALSPQTLVSGVSIFDNPALDQCAALSHVATWYPATSVTVASNGPCLDVGAVSLAPAQIPRSQGRSYTNSQ
jgi:hypothetical protein